MRPEFLGHFLRAFYLSERPGAVTELLRGLREALAPEMVPGNPAISIHLNAWRDGFAPGTSRWRCKDGWKDCSPYIATSNVPCTDRGSNKNALS